ncbi:hypothetical protein, partial [Bradyrhizobium sp. Mp19]|uniref:hypothetical protein n=1 Tax=Bradyrhizobium sp. Mp19 TaxID=3042156 RepID=UPI0024862569
SLRHEPGVALSSWSTLHFHPVRRAAFKARLLDLTYFYTRQNADRLGQFFTHELNSIYYKVEYTTVRGQPTLRFKKGASHYDLIRGSWAEKLEFDWPTSG